MNPESTRVAPEVADVELLRRVGCGDAAAFEEFHSRFIGFIRDVVYRTTGRGPDVDDVCQNALLAIWKQAWRFDPARSKPTTWIALVTRSVARDAFRVKLRTLRCDDSDGLEVMDVRTPKKLISPMESDEMIREARRTLNSLPQRQRSVVELAWTRGLTRRQIAKLEGLPVGTVKTLIRRGAERIRVALEAAA